MTGETRQAVLLGNPGTRRWTYFGQAALSEGLDVRFLDWQEWEDLKPLLLPYRKQGIYLKIDPPLWDSCSLNELNGLAANYRKQMEEVARLEDGFPVRFFNHPKAILELLDKRACKKTLSQAGIPVTEEFKGTGDKGQVRDAEELLELMRQRKIFQVFIKPVKGSGAAGIGAFRFQPKTGNMVLYTCALENQEDSGLVNTKKLRCFSETGHFGGNRHISDNLVNNRVIKLLNRILALDCIVERWYPKGEVNGYSYDLRAVVQDGQMDFCLARLSKGPITNLHLNNHPMPASQLPLPPSVFTSVEKLCRDACRCYPGLRSAGIDLLLEKGSLTPRIIEMNGQGDLIYQDIFADNQIYRHQARMMKTG